jgi:hypothetical protein
VLISILGAYQLPIGTFSTRDACAAAAREAVHIEASGQVVSNQPLTAYCVGVEHVMGK